jgi:hypothetical protein
MAITLGTPVNARRIVDLGLSNTVSLPNASSTTTNTGWLNMAQPGGQPYYWNSGPSGVGGTQPGGTTNSPNGPYVATERVVLQVITTASTNGNNAANGSQSILLYLQQAPPLANGAVDTGNITNVPLRSNFGLGGNVAYITVANGGNAATYTVDALPPGVYQYLRIQAQSAVGANNSADANVTIQLGF